MKVHCNDLEYVPEYEGEDARTLMSTAMRADSFLYHLNDELDKLEMILFGTATPDDLKESFDAQPLPGDLDTLLESIKNESEKCYDRLYNMIDKIG